jgi:hypothetical protein
MIKVNEGSMDRIIRVIAGVALLVIGFAGIVPDVWGTVIGVVGLIPLATGLLGWCPLYTLFGFSTCPVKK